MNKMFKSIALYRNLKLIKTFRANCLNALVGRQLSSDTDNKSGDRSVADNDNEHMAGGEGDERQEKTLSFAKAFEKFERMAEETRTDRKKEATSEESEPFPTLLRYSPFIQMGDPVGKVVVGRVEDVVDDDLYIDFGGKFNAVCKRPKTNNSDYVRGSKVRLRINDLEISDRFLGSTKDMTLLEADATLMGLIWSPTRSADRSPDIESN